MMIGGGYLFLKNIQVTTGFGMGYRLYSFWGIGITGGTVLIPFIFGVGMLFYNSRNPIGWVLAAGSMIMLAFGVISQTHFRFNAMSAFDLITILVLLVGGIGLFLSSLRTSSSPF